MVKKVKVATFVVIFLISQSFGVSKRKASHRNTHVVVEQRNPSFMHNVFASEFKISFDYVKVFFF